MVCPICSLDFAPRVKNQRFCSMKCKRQKAKNDWRQANQKKHNLPSASIGAIHEYLVGIDLLRRGFHVFRALSPSSPGDLAVLVGDRLLLVEVTTGIRLKTGTLSYPKHSNQQFHSLAVVEHSGTITYIPELTLSIADNLPS